MEGGERKRVDVMAHGRRRGEGRDAMNPQAWRVRRSIEPQAGSNHPMTHDVCWAEKMWRRRAMWQMVMRARGCVACGASGARKLEA